MPTIRLAVSSDELSQFNGDEVRNDGQVQTAGLGQVWNEHASAIVVGYDASQENPQLATFNTAPAEDLVWRHGAQFLPAFGNQNQFQDPGNSVDLRTTWFILRPGYAVAPSTVVPVGPMTRVTDRYCTYVTWLSAAFTMPAVGSTVQVTVESTLQIAAALSAAAAISATARLYIDGGNWMEIESSDDDTHCTLKNLGVAGATVSAYLS